MQLAYYFCKVLKLEAYCKWSQIKMHVISRFNKYATQKARDKMLRAIIHHKQAQSCMERGLLNNFCDINNPVNKLEGRTLCNLLMEISQPGNPIEIAFLAVNMRGWGGGGIMFSYAKCNNDVMESVKFAPASLYHRHGDPVLKQHSPDVAQEAINMEWDNNNDRPIPFKEKLATDGVDTCSMQWVQPEFFEKLKQDNMANKATAHPVHGRNNKIPTSYQILTNLQLLVQVPLWQAIMTNHITHPPCS